MNNISKSISVLIGLTIISGLFAFQPKGVNNDLLQRIIANLDSYNKLLPQEKLYMHVDRPYYIAGEDIF